MTGQQLIEKINKLKLEEVELSVSVRVKTGYDEGDIFEQSIASINKKGEITLGTCKLVGGW